MLLVWGEALRQVAKYAYSLDHSQGLGAHLPDMCSEIQTPIKVDSKVLPHQFWYQQSCLSEGHNSEI